MDLTVDIHITGTFTGLNSDEVAEMIETAKADPLNFVHGLNSPVVDVEVSATA